MLDPLQRSAVLDQALLAQTRRLKKTLAQAEEAIAERDDGVALQGAVQASDASSSKAVSPAPSSLEAPSPPERGAPPLDERAGSHSMMLDDKDMNK